MSGEAGVRHRHPVLVAELSALLARLRVLARTPRPRAGSGRVRSGRLSVLLLLFGVGVLAAVSGGAMAGRPSSGGGTVGTAPSTTAPGQTTTAPVAPSGGASSAPAAVPSAASTPTTVLNTSEWQLNGSATIDANGSLLLTDGVTAHVASAWMTTPVSVDSITVSFDLTIDTGCCSGEHADGVTVDLLDAASQTPTAIGGGGGELGF
jgi:hypothetical protein